MNNTIENFEYGQILESSQLNDRLVQSINNINTTLQNIQETIGNTEQRTGILGTLYNLQTQIDGLSPESTTIYQLYLDKTSLVFNHNNEGELIPTEQTINVHCKKTQGNKTTIIDIPNGFHCTYGYGGSVYTLNSPYTITVEYSSIINQSYLYISLTDSDNETVDVISVPIIIDGINGTDGTSTIIKGNAINIEIGDPYGIEDYYNDNPDEKTILGDMILIDDNDDPDGHIIIKRVPEYYDEEREKTTNFTFIEVNIGDGYVIENNRVTLPYEGHLFVASERGEYGEFANWHDSGRIAGKTGSSGYAFRTIPESIIVTEQKNGNNISYVYPNKIQVKVNIEGVDNNITINSVSSECLTVAKVTEDGEDKISIIGIDNSYQYGNANATVTQGIINVTGTYNGKGFFLSISVYFNRLGQMAIAVQGDTITEVANKLVYGYNNPTEQGVDAIQHMGQYIRSSEVNISEIKATRSKEDLFNFGLNNWTVNDAKYPDADFDKDYPRYWDKSEVYGDIYSPVISLKPGVYCFSAYVRGDFDTSSNSIALQQGCSVETPGDGTTISASDIGVITDDTIKVDGTTYQRKYAIFEIAGSKSLCSVNLWGNTYGDVVRPKLEKGSTPTPWQTTVSQIKQTANNIDFSITNKLGEVGIKIDGTNREIDITGAKVRIGDEDQTVALFENGKIKADLVDANKVTSQGNGLYTNIEAGKFSIGLINENDNTQKTAFDIAIDDAGNAVLRYYNKEGSLIGMIDPSFFTSSEAIGNTWRPIKLKKVSNQYINIPSYRDVDLVVKNTSAQVFTTYVFSEGYTKYENSKTYNVSNSTSPSIFNTKYLNNTYSTNALKEKIQTSLQSECYFASGIYVPEKAVPFGTILSQDSTIYQYLLYVIQDDGSGYTTVSGNSTQGDNIISVN